MIATLIACCLVKTNSWTISTSETVATIGIANDRPVIQALGNVSDAHKWCHGSPIELIDHVWQDGKEIPVRWRFELGKLADSKLVLAFASTQPPLELRSIWRARKGRGPIEHWIEIENRSKDSVAIPQQESLTLSGLDPGGEAQIWWIKRGGSNAMTEGGTFQNPAKPGLNLDLVSNNHDGSSPVPWLAVQVGSKRGLYVGWEFSGLGRLHASASSANDVSLKAGLMPDFKTDIHAGETLVIPAAFVGCYRGDIDEGSQSLHRFVLEKLRPKAPAGFQDPALAYNLYLDAGGNNAKEADVLRSAWLCKDLGFEVFMPDAMWFSECGDWRWDPKRFPNGVRPIEQYVHESGMKMALWCAWDNGGISTHDGALSVRGPVGHPDWFSQTPAPDWTPGPFYGIQACMACPEALTWAMDKTNALVTDQKLDYLKNDIDPMVISCDKKTHRHAYGTDVSYWATRGVYEVWDRLHQAHPNLVIENCSGGSHIKDFGVVQRCLYTVVTDTLSNLPDRAAIYDSTFVLPPSALMAYTYERAYGQKGDDPAAYFWRSAMMVSWQIDPTNTAIWTDEDKASVRGCVRTYKQWVRPILQDCAVHHVLPRPDGKNWDGMFFWSQNLKKGSLFVFRPDAVEANKTVRLAGLDPAKRYLVWSEDGSISSGIRTGTALMNRGLAIKLEDRFSSDLICLQDALLPKPQAWGAPVKFGLHNAISKSDYIGSTTTLSWSKSQGAQRYRVQITATGPNQSVQVIRKIVYEPKVELVDLPPGGAVWSVEAIGIGGSRKSDSGSFESPKLKAWRGSFVSDLRFLKAEAGSDHVRLDENLFGSALSIGGTIQRKGIWTHSFNDSRPADIVVDLAGRGFATFASDVGLDDGSGGGSVQFQVLVDDKVVAESPVMRPREVHHFQVDVSSATRLTLRVLNGGDGYNSDHAVWGMARLLHPGAADPFVKN